MPSDNVLIIPDTNEARLSHSVVPDFGANYVREGFSLVADWDISELSVGRGRCLAVYDGEVYHAEVDARVNEDTLDIPAGTSGVWYDFDARAIVVGSDPGEPSLQVGSVDASAESVDESVNRTRDEDFGSVNAGEGRIGNVVWEQGTESEITTYTADGISITGTPNAVTVFDLSDPVDVLNGVVVGPSPDRVRVTYEDGSFEDPVPSGLQRGKDGAANTFSALAIPPIKSVEKLTVRGRTDGTYGYKVVTR